MTIPSWLKTCAVAGGLLGALALTAGLVAGERNPVRPHPLSAAPAEQARVIVQYKAGAALLRTHAAQAGAGQPLRYAQALAARHGLPLKDGRLLADRMQLVRAQGISSAALAARLAGDPDVEWAVVDGRRFAMAAPNDPRYPGGLTTVTPSAGQWYLRANGGEVKASINVESAWSRATGTGQVVAVLDTGITNHPDLADKLLPGYDFVGYSVDDIPTANDGDLDDADPADPGDWITDAENKSDAFKDCGVANSSWHGTQVSGLAAAITGNGVGMAGVARDAMLLPVRVLGKCGGYDSDIIPAMRWAGGLSVSGVAPNANPSRVLNLSLGGTGECTAAYRAALTELAAQQVVVVAAAGNEGLAVGVPANCPGVVAVAGVRHIGSKVGYSDLGPEVVVSAPGGNCVNESGTCLYPLLSTSNSGVKSPVASRYTTGGSDAAVGTSFSSPLVAGTVALMLSANPDLSPAQVTSALRTSARAFPTSGGDPGSQTCQVPGDTPQDTECYCTLATCGAGLADAGAAVTRAISGPFPSVTVSDRTPVAGRSVTLNATGSTALAGRSLASYAWSVVSGDAQFTSATNANRATLRVDGGGPVVVQLTVADDLATNASLRLQFDVAASALAAAISTSPSNPEVGDSIALSGAGSVVDAGRSIAAYRWEITAGASTAHFSGAADQPTATLVADASGSVTVRLTITDSAGQVASTSSTLSIKAAPVSSGGGGGALAPWWALGLAGLAAALRRRRAA
jgi:serine protease